ncbi:uncharacterized protein LOC114305749 [Camellia sinensis]|uniref:uncharacterized protein LOC114305749 n=1 Tax=Camellia sinensis TaxID=4442 RepID=UPI001035B6E4|nr:uncharacterized protein LOC114305749 [Camellia sinensis]
MALLEDKPADINEYSTTEQVALSESWKRFNRLSLMFMKMTIANNIKTSLPQTVNALEYLKAVEDRFRSADKSLAGTIMAELTTMKYDGNRGAQDHILNMADKAAKLKTLGMQVDETFLVQFILNSLLSQFGAFKIHYNTNKDKWSLTELTNMCVQEEVRLRKEGRQTALAITHGAIKKEKDKSKGYKFYCPNHSTRIVETGIARFLENGEISGSEKTRVVNFEEIRVDVPTFDPY